MIEIVNLNKKSSDNFSLKNISFNVPAGKILTIIGKSGSGKTTLLRCLAGLEEFTADKAIVPKPIGMVFQSSNLFPHLSLTDNIVLALTKVQKKPKAEALEIAHHVLAKVHLQNRNHSYPHQLSGGEQQRGAIARALALKPQVLLYDEPTSALDPQLQDELFNLISELQQSGIIQIIVTHETSAAKKLQGDLLYINHGELRLYSEFTQVRSKLERLHDDEKKYLHFFL